MKKYDNRIQKLKIDIEELEIKIAQAVHQNKSARAKRLNMILEKENKKLERWLRI